jgi:hypothetical protein
MSRTNKQNYTKQRYKQQQQQQYRDNILTTNNSLPLKNNDFKDQDSSLLSLTNNKVNSNTNKYKNQMVSYENEALLLSADEMSNNKKYKFNNGHCKLNF